MENEPITTLQSLQDEVDTLKSEVAELKKALQRFTDAALHDDDVPPENLDEVLPE